MQHAAQEFCCAYICTQDTEVLNGFGMWWEELDLYGVPDGIRTRVIAVKELREQGKKGLQEHEELICSQLFTRFSFTDVHSCLWQFASGFLRKFLRKSSHA